MALRQDDTTIETSHDVLTPLPSPLGLWPGGWRDGPLPLHVYAPFPHRLLRPVRTPVGKGGVLIAAGGGEGIDPTAFFAVGKMPGLIGPDQAPATPGYCVRI